jgi:hypothetical protein
MTPEAAIYEFLGGFGIPAYASTSVPSGADFPYLTYDLSLADLGETTTMSASLWYRTETEKAPNAKAREVYDALTLGGVILPCDGGVVWLRRGTPWVNSMGDDTDDLIKRRLLNIEVEQIITA